MAAVVGFLVISFAIWGIGDIFRGFGRSTVAKIGRTEITIEQFRTLYNDRLQQYSRQFGRPITPDQARAIGLDRAAITQIFSEILLDERAHALGLALSDAEVAKLITNDPAFRGPNGQFDRFRFEQIIRNAGYTEPRFVAEQRRLSLRRELAGTIASGLSAPRTLVEAANRYQNEQRSIEYALLDRALAGEIPPPPPEVLAKYFEERKTQFRAPEYRKLVIVSLIPTEQARWIEISDADLKRAYEERRARYVTPERRHILQIDFPNAEAASAAAERIAKGTSFTEIAKELGKSEKDIDLGTVPKAAVIDRAAASSCLSSPATCSRGRTCSGSILRTCTSTVPNRPCTGALTSPSLSAKAASAAARSITAALGTVPRSMSFSLLPSSLAISVKLVPFAMRSAAALAASALGKSICRM